ncbi:MAG: TetR/AcrR family transcriptional regulator C-terminal domain-containing protein [Pseudonocardia sp.]
MSSPLNRERIVRAAVTMIERDGPDAVSMRRLAADLDAGVMSLYNHVPNKAALLDAVAEHIMLDLEFAADPDAEWPDQARALMRNFREVGHRFPRSVMLVVTRQPHTPAGLLPVERALATARAAGFEGRAAVLVMRAFVNFAIGCLVHEAGRAGQGAAPGIEGLPDALVNVRELLPELSVHDPDAEFEFGLEMLISAMAALHRTGA